MIIEKRRIRVFVSSTFKDMVEDRDALMTHTWKAVRRICKERHVEFNEVDLRWGVSEEQSARKETLKRCLDAIDDCRPYFIGLLGERYGWVPDDAARTPDLLEEQHWLAGMRDRSATELEMLHGVLNEPERAKRAFFYIRDEGYARQKGADHLAEDDAAKALQDSLKKRIQLLADAERVSLFEPYRGPMDLALKVEEDLVAAIDADFPKEEVPNELTRERLEHEAFAESRREVYVERPSNHQALDRHVLNDGAPLVLHGPAGSGRSALLANWLTQWSADHPTDHLIVHYVGATSKSAERDAMLRRIIGEIKQWTELDHDVPKDADGLRFDLPIWLRAAGEKATAEGVRCIVVLDGLEQLEQADESMPLNWLPEQLAIPGLRVLISTRHGDRLEQLRTRAWPELAVGPLSPEERAKLIKTYLDHCGKAIDQRRLDRIARDPATADPQFLKILLEELRVTGTHDQLDARLDDYLAARSITELWKIILLRYRNDYERDRPGLVGDALGLIYSARRGLAENELLEVLKPEGLPQLPMALWMPLRDALGEGLRDHGGILNFASEELRSAVGTLFVPDLDRLDDLRIMLADYFEAQPITADTCDELPWLLLQTEMFQRLRACLLDIDRFMIFYTRNEPDLTHYWVALGEERNLGDLYSRSYANWSVGNEHGQDLIALAAYRLGSYLSGLAFYHHAELLLRQAWASFETSLGENHLFVGSVLNELGLLLKRIHQQVEAEQLLRRALIIDEKALGSSHATLSVVLTNLAGLLEDSNRPEEAEKFFRRALEIEENRFGIEHLGVAEVLCELSGNLRALGRIPEAHSMIQRALSIMEKVCGQNHPSVAGALNSYAILLQSSGMLTETEEMFKRALRIDEAAYGLVHPEVGRDVGNLAGLLYAQGRFVEAEVLMRRSLDIHELCFGHDHPKVAIQLNNLVQALVALEHFAEAESLMQRALVIGEASFSPDDPHLAVQLNGLGVVLIALNRPSDAKPLLERALGILQRFQERTGHRHPDFLRAVGNYALVQMRLAQ
ncbi:MAG: tetratricopeptide repeat protein [Flavobacteriales bacterium]|nr:tetratricopeptide repeat protein [Flavobacteriales bacterium]MCC6939327.1 tetratricopeptide repeat protein [Flavobacteriales bacterium]